MPGGLQGGNTTRTSLAWGGHANEMLPVGDTRATNKLIGVLVDNIHQNYLQCIKNELELRE